MKSLVLAALVLGCTASSASASTITFDEAGHPTGPKFFDSVDATVKTPHYLFGTLTVDFTGGTLLTDESDLNPLDPGDTSTVYATASQVDGVINVGDPNLANPLVITFSVPIVNFEMDILNAYAGNYLLSDNAGHSLLFTLPVTGNLGTREGFAATGTQVYVQYLGVNGVAAADVGRPFDFAIDNVTFNEPLSSVPEPGTWMLMGTGVALLATASRLRRRQRA